MHDQILIFLCLKPENVSSPLVKSSTHRFRCEDLRAQSSSHPHLCSQRTSPAPLSFHLCKGEKAAFQASRITASWQLICRQTTEMLISVLLWVSQKRRIKKTVFPLQIGSWYNPLSAVPGVCTLAGKKNQLFNLNLDVSFIPSHHSRTQSSKHFPKWHRATGLCKHIPSQDLILQPDT